MQLLHKKECITPSEITIWARQETSQMTFINSINILVKQNVRRQLKISNRMYQGITH